MTNQAVVNFMEKVAQDKELQSQLSEVLASQFDDRQATNSAAELAKKHGFDFTSEQLSAEIKKRQEEFQQRVESGAELSEQELETVSGGTLIPLAIAVAVGAISW